MIRIFLLLVALISFLAGYYRYEEKEAMQHCSVKHSKDTCNYYIAKE